MAGRFENILETIGRTPVVKVAKLAPPGVELFVKLEAFNPLGSIKDRLALGVIEAAERSGELKPGQTVIEATSGNTGNHRHGDGRHAQGRCTGVEEGTTGNEDRRLRTG